jgi:hypothetical protein
MPYEQYLQTARWRVTRNGALRRAGFKCHRCASGSQLQVHHLVYLRLGAELDDDLEVLCRGCHLGEHVVQIQDRMALYMKVISESLKATAFTSLADLLEDVKCRCARRRIPYADGQIHAALSRLDADKRLAFTVPVKAQYAELLDAGRGNQPLTHAEACGAIARLGAQGLLRPMATIKPMTQREADRKVVLRQVVALLIDLSSASDAAEDQLVRDRRTQEIPA